MDNLLKRVEQEFKNKLTYVKIEMVENIGLYMNIIKYLQQEKLSEEYIAFLLSQENILDYLLQAYMKNRHNFYPEIKNALDYDQISF